MEGDRACLSLHQLLRSGRLAQEVKRMDVKGARALSERLAEAARNVDLTPAKASGSGETERGSEVADKASKLTGASS